MYLYDIFIVFNLGEYRRNVTTAYRNHDFFRPDNESAMMIRTNCAKVALEDVMLWLENGGGEVAVSCCFCLPFMYQQVVFLFLI